MRRMGPRNAADQAAVEDCHRRGFLGARASIRQQTLIIHQNFPDQFRRIALHLATRPDVDAIGLGCHTAPGLPNFPWFKYKPHREAKAETHPYLRQMEAAVLHGQAVARALSALKRKGFVPDVILAHPSWGETLYAKEIYLQARLIHLCKWDYTTTGADFGFDREFPPEVDDRLRITTWDALHLQNCDAAVAPTHWQKRRFTEAYQDKIQVIHEGIDTEALGTYPAASVTQRLPRYNHFSPNLDLYRVFHHFMRALPMVLKACFPAQVMIVCGDGKIYGPIPKDAPNLSNKNIEAREANAAPQD